MKPPFTLERFIELYPRTTPVRFGELDLTLGQALDIQTLGCPVAPDKRNEINNIAYLAAKLVAAGTLRPPDYNLLDLVQKSES